MMYTSNLLSSYNAVFQHVDLLQTTYKKYGICFDYEVLVSEEGYKVVVTAKELQEETN